MKYKPLCAAAIFFWPIFTSRGGGMTPLAPPPDPLQEEVNFLNVTWNGVAGLFN